MKTVVLDDDPTGTQSATGVYVLLHWDVDLLVQTLQDHDAVYLQTNSRALDEAAAVKLSRKIREQIQAAEQLLRERVQVVLRGDSTLRGHVFSETDVFAEAGPDGGAVPVLFVPAFPAGGRTTVDGIHRVEIDGIPVPAHETEYAKDPVFPFSTANMVEYVIEKGARKATSVSLADLRHSGGSAVADALATADPMSFVVPDAVEEEDIDLIYQGLQLAWSQGTYTVVRSASPLAARVAQCASAGLLSVPLQSSSSKALFVCGSHTSGATAQLQNLAGHAGVEVVTVHTDDALTDPVRAGEVAAYEARQSLEKNRIAIIASERNRRQEDNTLGHGESVMRALTTAVAALNQYATVVIAKGGITSADVARTGLSSDRAVVRGQVLPGVSVWDLETPQGQMPYVVVPGNVGGPNTLVDVERSLHA